MASPLADPQQDSPQTSLLDDKQGHEEPAVISHLRALGITSSGFIRGSVQMGSMQVILPLQMSLMYPLTEAHMLGICVIVYGASKFCEPVIGKLCDNWASSIGRRLPLFLLANIFVLVSLCMMCHSVRDSSRGALYLSGFVLCMFAINIAEVPYHGIIADEAELRPRTLGILSGYKMAWFLLGAALCQVAVMKGYSTFLIYIALIASVPLFVAITFKSMRVLPSHPTNPPFQLTLRDAVACYAMTPTSHGVLFWITASYFFLSAALQWERFLFFFVRDCVTATIPAAKAVASVAYFICLIASACGALCYGAFACSHRFGDRRCWLVSTFGLCAMTVLMITIHTPVQLYCISLVFGAFNGFFLSSSFSLAVQHIPHGQQESLRVYGAGMANLVSPALLLDYFGGHKLSSSGYCPPAPLHDCTLCHASRCTSARSMTLHISYNRSGYTAMFVYCAGLFVVSASIIHWRITDVASSKY